MIFKILVIGHLLGDFYFQTEKIAKDKKEKVRKLLLHCIIYYVALLAMIIVFTESKNWVELGIGLIVVTVMHGVVDGIKIRLERKCSKLKNTGHIIFLLDQIIHIAILYAMSQVCSIQGMGNAFICSIISIKRLEEVVTPVLAAMICWKPASIFVSVVFQTIPNTIAQAEGEIECGNKECPYKLNNEEGGKIGSWIGVLEREIILILGLMGQFGAIGFVLTAKSLARFKQLENKAFAEKYLIGTLISAIIAILCVVMCGI